jgi:DNA-binding PadR family transcriptional regulator
MERDGLLQSRTEVVGKKRRRIYEVTPEGRKSLILSKVRLWELFKEVFEAELSPETSEHIEGALRIAMSRQSSPPGA